MNFEKFYNDPMELSWQIVNAGYITPEETKLIRELGKETCLWLIAALTELGLLRGVYNDTYYFCKSTYKIDSFERLMFMNPYIEKYNDSLTDKTLLHEELK
jgi:hypothetical protein